MAKVRVRYLVAKPQPNGTTLFYWQPNKTLRVAGYRAHRLASETNLLADAIAEAERFNADVDAWRAGTKPEPLRAYSLPWLIRLYCAAHDVDRFCATAINADRRSVAVAVRLAVNLGQREGDILRLTWAQHDADGFKIRQRKTGAHIQVPVAAELADALASTPKTSTSIVVSEITKGPYKADNFRAVFADIRKRAGIADVQFMDLRRTAVVRLAEAGCTVPEISAITGHSVDTTQKILEVYLPRTSTMAKHAIAKLESYRAQQVGSSNRGAGDGVGKVVPRGGFEPPTRGFSVRSLVQLT
jgi:integrase